jgi:CRISPR-associated endoribonuclease Cas6
MIDLVSLVLSLRPQAVPAAEITPTWWARAAHALLLQVVRQANPALSAALHSPPGAEGGADGSPAPIEAENELLNTQATRPFTCSTLLGRFPKGALDPGETYRLRLTGLHASVSELLLSAARTGALAVGQRLELDYIPFEIAAAEYGMVEGQDTAPASEQPDNKTELLPGESDHPSRESFASHYYTGAVSYAGLSSELLLAKKPAPRRLSLRFTSPASFKSGGKMLPVPLPELVFGSLLERWNAFAPIVFPPEARRYALECLALSRYELSTRPVQMKQGALRIGAVGDVTYVSTNYDRYWMSVIGTLAAFALYSGVGAGTTHGLGQCRLLAEAA